MLSAFNIINTAPFNPRSLNPALWLDAADPTTLFDATSGGNLVAAGGAIARWEDKSGNGRHLTQSTSGFRPTRSTSIQNNRDAISFASASAQSMSVQSNFLNALSGLSVFAVTRWSANAGGRGAVFSYGAASESTTDILYSQGVPNSSNRFVQINNGTDGSAYFPSSAPASHIVENLEFDGTQTGNANRIVMRQNSIAQSVTYGYTVPSSTASPSNPSFTVGGYFSFPSGWSYQGTIAEIIILPYATNASQRQTVERYLSQKWNIPLA